MSEHSIVSIGALHELVESIFLRAGLNAPQAGAATRAIVAAERDGCKSHGVYRVEGALRTLKAGMVHPDALPNLLPSVSAGIVRVDAGHGFANAALELGLSVLADCARENGIAALVVSDAVHFTALWVEVEALAAMGLAGLAMCPSIAAVAPAGGTKPLLGTNPIAFSWPRPGPFPYVFDFATSVAARGEVELHKRAGKPLPEGWAIDPDGQPTVDPSAALAGAMLAFGGHKGSALSTMIELLSGAMIGDLTSSESLARSGTTALYPAHGELVIAFDLSLFIGSRTEGAAARAEHLFDGILGQGARLPSQRRFAARLNSQKEGIRLSPKEMERLDRLLQQGLDAV